jgi:hypothetical protein
MSVTMLLRPRAENNPEAWNLPFDTTIVADTDIEDAAAEGWMTYDVALAATQPAEAEQPEPGPYDSFLDASVAEILPLLDDMSAGELRQLLAAEQGGKTRAGLVIAINKAIAAKTKD